ncbi:nucleotidyltransferase domain-containing protein [Chlorogloeopsis fritschii PCC 9212]|uniref:Polymerase nucleotidyl transferase domain-containing protein n=1 Tax=Chlorogloeopsis fritschii PCC 6912 TaxID=211165 RepID=A0A3S1AG02_CHLFR|nr:nucleotidyltransferase domain-containing protein [Chlorogloeopsis fritschii]RUR78718.1 hypothetical protein PCC6912_34830 [Chlorogloeopsis fritschii PCC 6912]
MEFSPDELNTARQSLLDKSVDYFLAKKGVEALFVQGSVASGNTDEFSDIDFRVVIQLLLNRDVKTDLHWINILFDLCRSKVKG